MSKYVLNKNNTLVLKDEVYALVRGAELTKNSVCDQCALYDKCHDIDDDRHFTNLCIPEPDDERWFFINAGELSKLQQDELKCYVDKYIDILKYY